MIRHSLIAIAISSIISLPVAAEGMQKSADRTATPAAATLKSDHARLNQKRDDAMISLTGTVTRATRDGFVLDYGKGQVNVEMNDWEWYGRDFQTLENTQVTVMGRIDDDWVKRRSIEADSVFAKNTQTLHRSADADIESTLWLIPPGGSQSNWIRGEVSGIDPAEQVVRLRSGNLSFDVGIADLPFDPIDGDKDEPLELDIGDDIIVSGDLVADPTQRHRVLNATSLVLLSDDAPNDLVSSASDDE